MVSGMDLRERAAQLKRIEAQLPGKLRSAAFNATLRAIETAVDETPPVTDNLKGTNTRTGEMKEHWVTDSKPAPQKKGGAYTSTLANDKEYASYVDQGHRMDRHFVPGLVLNEESGMLEYNPNKKGGIVVGTKTKYVRGLHIVDKAKEQYEKTLKKELEGLKEMIE